MPYFVPELLHHYNLYLVCRNKRIGNRGWIYIYCLPCGWPSWKVGINATGKRYHGERRSSPRLAWRNSLGWSAGIWSRCKLITAVWQHWQVPGKSDQGSFFVDGVRIEICKTWRPTNSCSWFDVDNCMTLGGSRPMQPGNMAVCSLCFKGDYRTGGGRMIYFFPLPFAILMVSHFRSSTFRRAELRGQYYSFFRAHCAVQMTWCRVNTPDQVRQGEEEKGMTESNTARIQ